MKSDMTMRHGALLVTLLCVALLNFAPAHAQLDFGTDFSLSITPKHPAPGDTVRATVKSLLLDLESGNVSWYINGARAPSGAGLAEFEVKAGPLGSVTRVRAAFSEAGFERAVAEALIRPTEIDLLWEADSYTPPFFRGRALPSAGVGLRVEAIPRFKRADGSLVSSRDITFTWRKNGYVIQGVSGRGKSRAILDSPPLFGTDTISVEARTPDSVFAGEASVRIPTTDPILILYENHPLYGVMYHRALGTQNILPEVEMSFAAVPYFADASDPNDRNLVYEWSVDGNRIDGDPSRPNEITINASGSSGIAQIALALSHATNLFLNSSGSWVVTLLGEDATGGQGNPFGATP